MLVKLPFQRCEHWMVWKLWITSTRFQFHWHYLKVNVILGQPLQFTWLKSNETEPVSSLNTRTTYLPTRSIQENFQLFRGELMRNIQMTRKKLFHSLKKVLMNNFYRGYFKNCLPSKVTIFARYQTFYLRFEF